MAPKNMMQIVRRKREATADREKMEELGLSRDAIGLIFDDRSSFRRNKIIDAIKKGEVGKDDIDGIRKKIKAINENI